MSVQVTFTGNAGRDPENRTFNDGGSITTIPVAVSQGYFDKSHNWVDHGTMWIDVEATAGYTAAQIQAARKGSKLLVTGVLQQRQYTTSDGREATALKCRATGVGILHKNTQDTPSQTSQPTSSQQSWTPADDPWANPQNNNSEFAEPDF